MYHAPSSRCVKYVLKIFQTKIMKNEIFKKCSWKRTPLFDKGHLDKPKGQVEVESPKLEVDFDTFYSN